MNSLSYTVPNDSPWEIAIDEPEGGTKMLILPHILEVSMTFTPIGEFDNSNAKYTSLQAPVSLGLAVEFLKSSDAQVKIVDKA